MTTYLVNPAKKPLLGYVSVPGDKSIAHRALMFGGLASGTVKVRGVSAGADNGRSARAMASMGVRMERDGEELIIHGVGVDGLRAPASEIDCGNSGTTIRLLSGLLAGQRFSATLFGDESLSGRPMRRVIDPLTQMGAVITGSTGAKAGDIYPPLKVAARPGPLSAIDYTLPMASAQVKSALILASLYTDGKTRLKEPGASRDHTEIMLAAMGAPVATVGHGVVEVDTAGWNRRLDIDRIDVPGDPSQAAFVIAAALIAGVERVTVGNVCINKTRTGFLDVLANMGALVELESRREGAGGGEPTADLSVSRGAGNNLRGTVVSGDLTVRSIDEIPILAIVAARAEGVTEFRDAEELRVKESDRIAETCAMLRSFGVDVEERPDGFSVQGKPDTPLRAARVVAQGDHRIAMTASVAGLVADGTMRVDGAETVATSFPTFVEVMTALGVDIEVRETD